MKKCQSIAWFLLFAAFTLLLSEEGTLPASHAAPLGAIQAPVLKWQRGGCYSSWCETGWYSSPAVADLDKDGSMEVIGATYSIFILDGRNGSQELSIDPPGGRVWPGVVVTDLEGDGDLEIVTAHGEGYVHVFDHNGGSVWSGQPVGNELRGLSVYDLDGDGKQEIIVTGAVYGKVNTWVYQSDGTLSPGWPQLSDSSGYAYGVFNDNAAVGDLDGDGTGEIVVPSDVHYICAYEPDGDHIPANAIYGTKAWGAVGIWENLNTELRGWGTCNENDGRAERYRTNFAHGASVIADVNSDGKNEVVATGNVYDCAFGHPPGKYNGVYVFKADRSRFKQDDFNWKSVPVNTGAPLSEDYGVIENNQPNPVVVDLDGDGNKEILYASYDGRVHAFWLDKTEHGHWPYSVYKSAEGFFRFASEPVVADLDGDGYAEVIFASWVEKGTGRTGKLHILNYLGTPLQEVDLPRAFGSPDWNGALAAPTLANIDDDPDLEVVLNTAHSGLVAYDLPDTPNARILWGTGRGSYLRNGMAAAASATTKPVVTIAATDPKASEVGSDRGVFRITRSGDTASALIVNYTVGGSASNGVDYRTLSGRVKFAAGVSSRTLTVVPVDDAQFEGKETVIARLSGSSAYEVGSSSRAVISIADDDLPVVTITATDPTASEQNQNKGRLTVTRTGNPASDLVVKYTVAGTATGNLDYAALSGRVKIKAGTSSRTITVTPIVDTEAEENETVKLTLSASPSYQIGLPKRAVVTIEDGS